MTSSLDLNILQSICLCAFISISGVFSIDPRFQHVIDPELGEQLSILKRSAGRIGEELIGSSSNVVQSKRDLASDPDLWGGLVKVQGRQLGQSRTQIGPDGGIIGFKDPGVLVPWGPQIVGTGPPKFTTEEPSVTVDPIVVGPNKGTGPPKFTTEEPSVTVDPIVVGPNKLNRLMPKFVVKSSSLFGGCGKIRTCFAYPDGCIETRDCRLAASIFEEDTDHDWIKVTLAAAAPHGFVAIGFSEDRFMGDDIVVHCNHIPSGPLMTLHLSANKGFQNFMQKDHKRFQSSLSATAGFVQNNGVIACEFDMSTTLFLDDSGPNGTDLMTRELNIFLAFGRFFDDIPFTDPDFGTLRWHDMAMVSDEKVRFQDIFNKPKILHPRGRVYILLHVIPYILAFSFFNPCAIFIAKYGREAYGQLKTDKEIPLWLLIHVSFQVIAMILSIIGLIAIMIELGGTWRSVSGKAIFHSVFGFFGTLFIWFNAFFGAMGLGVRGKSAETDSDRQYHYFRWMHWYFGNSVYIFGMGSLFIAIYLRRAHTPCVFQYIVCLQMFVHLLTHIVMSMHTYWLVTNTDMKHLFRRVMPGPMIQWDQNDMPEWRKGQRFDQMDIWCGRRRSVIFYFITSLICCIGMIGIMFVPVVLCRQA